MSGHFGVSLESFWGRFGGHFGVALRVRQYQPCVPSQPNLVRAATWLVQRTLSAFAQRIIAVGPQISSRAFSLHAARGLEKLMFGCTTRKSTAPSSSSSRRERRRRPTDAKNDEANVGVETRPISVFSSRLRNRAQPGWSLGIHAPSQLHSKAWPRYTGSLRMRVPASAEHPFAMPQS